MLRKKSQMSASLNSAGFFSPFKMSFGIPLPSNLSNHALNYVRYVSTDPSAMSSEAARGNVTLQPGQPSSEEIKATQAFLKEQAERRAAQESALGLNQPHVPKTEYGTFGAPGPRRPK